MTGDAGGPTEVWVVDDESTRGYAPLLSIAPRRTGRTIWLLAQALDFLHGMALLVAGGSVTAVVAVACQHDPTDDISDEDAHELASHWRGGLALTVIGLVVALLALLALRLLCRWARTRIDPVVARDALSPTPTPAPRRTRREVRDRDRRQNRWIVSTLVVSSLVVGTITVAVLGHPIWDPGLDPLVFLGRLLGVAFLGVATIGVAFAAVLLPLVALALAQLFGSVGRRSALQNMLGGKVISPDEVEEPAVEPEPTGPAPSFVAGPDPALLAYLVGPPDDHRRSHRRRVPVGRHATPVAVRELTGWMVAFSLWWLVDRDLVRLFVVRRGLLRRRRILIERIRPGRARGSVVGVVTEIPTDDLDAYVDEDTRDRVGPLGELRSVVSGWTDVVDEDPDWKVCEATFDHAVAEGYGIRGTERTYTFLPGPIESLEDDAERGRAAFERFERQRPVLATILLREGRKAVGSAKTWDLESPSSIRTTILFAWGAAEHWWRRRSRPWPAIIIPERPAPSASRRSAES